MVIVEQFVIYHYNEKQMTFIHKLYIPDCDYIAAVPLYVPAAIHTGRVIEGPWWAVDHSSPLCVQLHLTTTSSWETHTHARTQYLHYLCPWQRESLLLSYCNWNDINISPSMSIRLCLKQHTQTQAHAHEAYVFLVYRASVHRYMMGRIWSTLRFIEILWYFNDTLYSIKGGGECEGVF